jgi:pyruvate/2-oxoglutarate dehydrogenase complex dihydrolipoamide dehydrogenase (E3) component
VEAEEGRVRVHAAGPAGEDRVFKGSHLLVATGRRPVFEGLGLEAGGVLFDERGILTSPALRSRSNPRVWAVGDATGRSPLTHAAGWHASVWVRNALFKTRTNADAPPIPSVAYCAPEVAQIGLSEPEAKSRLGEAGVRVARWRFEENDRAQAEGACEGFVKIVTNRSGRILGASLVGEGAGDLIQIIALAMSQGLGIRALTAYIAPYPTRGEIIKRAAGQWFAPTLFSDRTRALVKALQAIP